MVSDHTREVTKATVFPALGGWTRPPHRLLRMSLHTIVRCCVVLLLAACTASEPTAPGSASRAESRMHSFPTSRTFSGGAAAGRPGPITKFALEHAARGLLYLSESDFPFTYYFHAGPAPTPLTIDAFRATVGIPADSLIEERTLDEFFARHIELVDPADSAAVALVPRYIFLRETIRNAVRQPRVFRVGRIAIKCYIVGTDQSANIVGLTTIAIET
jgi:hypothetical protein